MSLGDHVEAGPLPDVRTLHTLSEIEEGVDFGCCGPLFLCGVLFHSTNHGQTMLDAERRNI